MSVMMGFGLGLLCFIHEEQRRGQEDAERWGDLGLFWMFYAGAFMAIDIFEMGLRLAKAIGG